MNVDLLVFHGSNSEKIPSCVSDFSNSIAQKTSKPFFVCFLKASPSLEETLIKCVESNLNEIRIIPLFLLPGKHIKNDIPKIIKQSQQRFPQVKICLEPELISDFGFIEYISNRIS